jgi:hypothetical protein
LSGPFPGVQLSEEVRKLYTRYGTERETWKQRCRQAEAQAARAEADNRALMQELEAVRAQSLAESAQTPSCPLISICM